MKLSQVLRSALSSAAPAPCRRLAAHCVASMVAALKGQADEEAATNESNQQELNEAMPKLVAAMVSCAAGDDETGAEAKVRQGRQAGRQRLWLLDDIKAQNQPLRELG